MGEGAGRLLAVTGWRSGEILALTWNQVDRQAGVIRLATSKTGEGRVLPLVGELAALLERRWGRRALGSPWVFHRRGKPVRWFRGAWLAACKAAGLPDKLFHDFRRTAARDLIAAGHDYKAAMSVTGHRTMSTFLRYQIVDTRQTASALAGLQAHRQAKRTRGQGTDTAGWLGHEGLQ
jgi:integrase